MPVASIDRERQPKGGEGAKDQTDLHTGLALLDGDDPLPSYAYLAGELGLAQLALPAVLPNDQAELERSADLHDPSLVSPIGDTMPMSSNDDKQNLSPSEDILACGRSETFPDIAPEPRSRTPSNPAMSD